MVQHCGIYSRLNRVMALLALVLAIVWVPMTSHELLKVAGWIHQEGPAGDHWHYGPAHEAADGIARVVDGGTLLKAPNFSASGVMIAFAVLFSVFRLVTAYQAELPLQRTTESPPGLIRSWQFVLRMALPGRDPTFAL